MGRPVGRGADPLGRRARECNPARPARGDAAAPGGAAARGRGDRPRLRERRNSAGAQGTLARVEDGRRLGGPALAGSDLVPPLDGPERASRRDAGDSQTVNPYLIALLWAVVGAAGGRLVGWGSVKLAVLEGLEPGRRWWQEYGPPVLCAALFAIYGFEITSLPLLIVRSVFVLVLGQVIFFDFEHHLILDRVMFPAMVFALLVTLTPLVTGNLGLWHQAWFAGIGMGVAAGLLFLLLSFAGSAIFKADSPVFVDVKLVLFMSSMISRSLTVTSLFTCVSLLLNH